MLEVVEAQIAARRQSAMDEIQAITKAKHIEDLRLEDRQGIIAEAISEIVDRHGGQSERTRKNTSPKEWREILSQRQLIAEEFIDGIASAYDMTPREVYTLFMSPEIIGEAG